MAGRCCYGDGVLNPVTRMHHVVVAIAAAVVPVLVVLGLAGDGMYPERFEAKQVLVTPVGDGVRIREVVDIDFGNTLRHGYRRTIPNDFGVPVDVVASSPDAPDDLGVSDLGSETEIRIGDPNSTTDGQHRYVLEYTLPDANLSSGQLALNIIGVDETLETERFEIVITGMRLAEPTCYQGSGASPLPCTLDADGDLYRAVIEPLEVGQALAVSGTVTELTPAADVPIPELPPRRHPSRVPALIATPILGVLASFGTYRWMRRSGRNLVGGTGAADAAFGGLPGPGRLVTDQQLEAMATTEFEPPRGLRPWHGSLLLREKVDNDTVSAWFSDQIAQGVVELRGDADELVAGPQLASAPPITQQRIGTLLTEAGSLQLGTHQPRLTTLWKQIEQEQVVAARESGWWQRYPPGTASSPSQALGALGLMVLALVAFTLFTDLRHLLAVAVVASILLPAVVAFVAYRPLLPRRSAEGSAAALRAESFRRFLKASEGRHVDWAWEHGLLREYSAWAVALGAADAWGRAVAASAVPPPEVAVNTMPLLMYSHGAAWHSSYTTPSSSGSGGGGGFSGGGGSFGGGGSSGSW